MIKSNGSNGNTVSCNKLINDLAKLLFLNNKADFKLKFIFRNRAINKAQILRNRVIKDYSADCGYNNSAASAAVFFF